ncbi:hypothetical protein ABZZ47_25985 [Streptomyces sp. NPDC006465]|uniref:hypothetical protein n=1 Tax=Streptomyces sp. NPDC006465 TaxID=3157174 RepID=UPI0033A522F3
MKIRRWAGVTAVAVGGALIGLAGCGDSDKPTGAAVKESPTASVQPLIQPEDLPRSRIMARVLHRVLGRNDMQACRNRAQCSAKVKTLRGFVQNVQVTIRYEAYEAKSKPHIDPYYEPIVESADVLMKQCGDVYLDPSAVNYHDVYTKAQSFDKLLKEMGLE